MNLQVARSVIRDALGWALFSSGATRPNAKTVDQLTIVTFHRVLAVEELVEYPLPGLAVTPDQLRWLLQFFRRYYDVVPLSKAIELWRGSVSNEKSTTIRPLKKPLLVVTFDDALRDNFRHARPILDQEGVKATFFVPVEAVEEQTLLWHDRMAYLVAAATRQSSDHVQDIIQDFLRENDSVGDSSRLDVELAIAIAKKWSAEQRLEWLQRAQRKLGGTCVPKWDAMMSWDQLQVLAKSGHEIGSHSWTHPILPRCNDGQLQKEIVATRGMLEKRIETEVRTFCYPNGDWDQRCVDAVRSAGFHAAVTTTFGVNCDPMPLHLLRRCDMQSSTSQNHRGKMSEARIAWRLSRWFPGIDSGRP